MLYIGGKHTNTYKVSFIFLWLNPHNISLFSNGDIPSDNFHGVKWNLTLQVELWKGGKGHNDHRVLYLIFILKLTWRYSIKNLVSMDQNYYHAFQSNNAFMYNIAFLCEKQIQKMIFFPAGFCCFVCCIIRQSVKTVLIPQTTIATKCGLAQLLPAQ